MTTGRITGISRELLMQIKELAEDMGFKVLHGIVDCLWVIGEPISGYKEAVEKETGILTEVETPTAGSLSCLWPMAQVVQSLFWSPGLRQDEDPECYGTQW